MKKPEHCLVHGQSLMSLRDPKYHAHRAAKAGQAAGIAFYYSMRQDLVYRESSHEWVCSNEAQAGGMWYAIRLVTSW